MNKELTAIEKLFIKEIISEYGCKDKKCRFKNECDRSIKEDNLNLCYRIYEKMKNES